MKIEVIKNKRYTFSDVPCGDLFAFNGSELYVKDENSRGVSIRDGHIYSFLPDQVVKEVKKITVEVED